MMKKKIYLGFSLMLAVGLVFGQVKMEKDYDETFEVVVGNKVEVNNKYGEVIIRTWGDSNVRVIGKIIAQGRNQDVVNKTMNRVRLDMRKVGQLVTIDTDIQKRGGTFTELFQDVEDYSKALFGNQKLRVNLEIWLPENIDLSINNKYGDVYLASLSGDLDITLAHGDLKADRIEGRLDMEHSFGKVDFDFVNRGRFLLRGSDISIDEGSSFSFQSSSSELFLTNTHYVKLNSRNDKIQVRNVNELVGTGRFTDLEAENLKRNVDLNFDFGEITLGQIEQKFKNISLTTKSTDINLTLNQASYIKTRITGDENKMIVPNSMLSLTRTFDKDNDTVTLSGMLGPTQDFQSVLNVRSESGDLIISIKDIPVVTDRR